MTWWKKNENTVRIIVFGSLLFLVIGISLFYSFQEKEENYADSCKPACNNFGLEYYSSEENYAENDRCWCLKDGLPYEIPLKK